MATGGNNSTMILLIVGFIILCSFFMSPDLSAISAAQKCDTTDRVVTSQVEGSSETIPPKIRKKKKKKPRRAVTPFEVNPVYQEAYDRIDAEDAETRCAKYDLKPYDGPPRRIFYGTMVANENWEVFRIHAAEVYDVYHTAIFVESNTTHMATPRKMNFYNSHKKDVLQKSGIMGKNTRVSFNYWMLGMPVDNLIYMDRESEQRNTIIKGWKEAGMTPQDLGLMADIDETFSRDFLRAAQVCDFKQLDTSDESCKTPKIVPMALSYETSPYCLKKKEWFHPDIISGHCVEGIGDPTERYVPLRTVSRSWGERSYKYGMISNEQYPDAVLKLNRIPLFNGPDIRVVHGDMGMPMNLKDRPDDHDTAAYGVAYHFHNWFKDGATIRNKYLTYAHAGKDVHDKTLSQMSGDLDLFVRCAKGLDNDANPNTWADDIYFEGSKLEGPKPIFFLDKEYAKARHEKAIEMLNDDEEIYGSSYAPNGTWVEGTKMTEDQRRALPPPVLKKLKPKPKIMIPNEESRHTTVIATALDISEYDIRLFIGSLRKTGYSGNIIIGIEDTASKKMLRYYAAQNVTTKPIAYASNCTFAPFYTDPKEIEEEQESDEYRRLTRCAEPYPDIKLQSIRYPLGRDWLRECTTCTGPVLISDVRDVYFQDDPFGPGSPEVKGLQIFEEHPDVDTEHWVVDWPIGSCKDKHWKEPRLNPGIAVGTVDAMIKYMDMMYDEMKVWLADPKCRFKAATDDQPIMNWLFYSGGFKGTEITAIRHRDGIANLVGYGTSEIWRSHLETLQNEKNTTIDEAHKTPLPGKNNRTWISPEVFGITDEDGYFTNSDGTRSRVIFQWEGAGEPLLAWMRQHFIEDE